MLKQSSMMLVLMIVLGLIGCAGGATPTATPAPESATVQLSWVHSIEFAGIYEALQQNFYAQQNLTVTINGGGFNAEGAYIDPVAEVVSGQAQFGVAGADVVLRARSQGQPVVAVMSLYQRSPVTLISLPEANITRPQDLAGKRVGIAPPGTTVYISYHALLESEGVDASTITEVPMDAETSVTALLNGEIDVLHAFVTHEATQARALRDDVEVLVLSDYGIDIYNNVIFTTEDVIAQQPQLVQAFVQGTTQGLKWAVDHPEESARHVVETYGDMIPAPLQELQKDGMLASVPLIRPASSQPGLMQPEVWANTAEVLETQGLIEQPVDASKAYNLSFLNQVYDQ